MAIKNLFQTCEQSGQSWKTLQKHGVCVQYSGRRRRYDWVYHRRANGLQTYVRRSWLIVSVNLGYSFNVHA